MSRNYDEASRAELIAECIRVKGRHLELIEENERLRAERDALVERSQNLLNLINRCKVYGPHDQLEEKKNQLSDLLNDIESGATEYLSRIKQDGGE